MRMNHAAGVTILSFLVSGCSAESPDAPPHVDAAVQQPTSSGAGGSDPSGSGGSHDVTLGGGAGDNVGSSGAGGATVGGGAGLDGGGTTGPGGGGAAMGGNGGSASGGAAGVDGGQPVAQTFACSEMVGLWVMSQWWGTFEKGVDNARWQYIFVHHGYLETWADPASAYWKTNVISPCAAHPEGPDRVIFLPFSLSLNTLDQWQTNLAKVVLAIKMNFPSAKRIEFISTIRSPGNQPCPNDNDPNIVVPAYVDQAIQNVADGSGGLVTVGPKIAVANCNWWTAGTDLTGAGNTGVGQLYADYYKDH
jgi:hypothetical protein